MDAVRPFTDAVKILRVVNSAFLTVAHELGFTKQMVPAFPAFIPLEAIQEQMTAGAEFFGYCENEELLGTIAIKDLSQDSIFKIERLAVLPDHRHKKIGGLLMTYAEQAVIDRGGKFVEVEIVNENERLKAWYIHHHGFREIRIDTYDWLPFAVGVLRKTL